MCGFLVSNDPLIGQDEYSKISSALAFRGPDAENYIDYTFGWKAYHSRLSIIGVSNEFRQPYRAKTGMLVFNGEILNFKSLGEKYFSISFDSDTALLAALIDADVLDISELEGFFAFAFVGEDGKLKYCARDGFGVKPLFYYRRGSYISICSEASALEKLFSLGVNRDAIDEYRALRAPVFSRSYFNEVSEVTAGSCLINGCFFDASSYLSGEYQQVEDDEIEYAVRRSVSSREVSDVPCGILMSGGIDSNLVRQYSSIDEYYSVTFDLDASQSYDYNYVNSISSGTVNNYLLDTSDFRSALKNMVLQRGEPLSVPNEVLLYSVAKRAKSNGVKVLLSGEGADEFFGGYDRIFSWAASADNFCLDTFLSLYCYSPVEKTTPLYERFEDLFSRICMPNCFETVRLYFVLYHMPLLFRRLDFSLMFAGVEGREPLATRGVFALAAKMGPPQLMKSGLGKMPLRRIAAKYYGDDFAFAKKVGFPVDLQKVFGDDSMSSYEIWFSRNLGVLKW